MGVDQRHLESRDVETREPLMRRRLKRGTKVVPCCAPGCSPLGSLGFRHFKASLARAGVRGGAVIARHLRHPKTQRRELPQRVYESPLSYKGENIFLRVSRIVSPRGN